MKDVITEAFVEAARQALATMALAEMEVDSTATDDRPCPDEVVVALGLTGAGEGLLLLSMSRKLAAELVARMLGAEGEELSPEDVADGIAELANMVAGGAKSALAETEHAFQLSLPTVIEGGCSQVRPVSGSPGLVVHATACGEPLSMTAWLD